MRFSNELVVFGRSLDKESELRWQMNLAFIIKINLSFHMTFEFFLRKQILK